MTDLRILGVIGTAGRGDDAARLDLSLYNRMNEIVAGLIAELNPDGLASGGAAYADHLVVSAYLEGLVPSLYLFLPAEFSNGAFVPNPAVQFNPGKTLNNYHEAFKRKTGIDSLAEIEAAIDKGAVVRVIPGFHRRNSEVANVSNLHLASFTFGTHSSLNLTSSDPAFNNARKAGLKDGGTAHTFGECWKAEKKSHYNLFEIKRQLDEEQALGRSVGF